MNNGTPSVLDTTSAATSAGSDLPCATCRANSAAASLGKRLISSVITLRLSVHGRWNSGRQVNTARIGAVWITSTNMFRYARGRVDPVQILHDEHHRLLLGSAEWD